MDDRLKTRSCIMAVAYISRLKDPELMKRWVKMFVVDKIESMTSVYGYSNDIEYWMKEIGLQEISVAQVKNGPLKDRREDENFHELAELALYNLVRQRFLYLTRDNDVFITDLHRSWHERPTDRSREFGEILRGYELI